MNDLNHSLFIPTRRVSKNSIRLLGFKIAEINKHKKLNELMDENAYYTSKGITYFNQDDLTESFKSRCVFGSI